MAKKKKSATRKLLIILGVVTVLLVVVIAIIASLGTFGGPRSTEVEVADVGLRTVTQVVTASGKIQPEVEVKISPDVSGEIVLLAVAEGDQVRQGQLLARIKPDYYEAQVEQAEASVLQAMANEAQQRASLLNAEFDSNRQKALYEANAVSEADYQQAQTRFETAKAGLEATEYAVAASQARAREAREQLAKTTIFSPMDGTVSQLNIELGERVVGTTQMTGTEMMRVARLDQMEMEVDVNENDVVNVTLGDSASVEIDAYPGRVFHGTVTEIANSARTTGQGTQEQVTNFPVKIRILDPHNVILASDGAGEVQTVTTDEVPGITDLAPSFRPGMSGTVDVFTKTVFDVIAIPIQSVTVRDVNALAREKKQAERRRSGARTDASNDVEDDGSAGDAQADTSAVVPEEEDLRRVVFLFDDGKATMTEVETGISDDTHIVILSGVNEGQRVITGPFRAVSRTLKPEESVREKTDRPGMPSGGSESS